MIFAKTPSPVQTEAELVPVLPVSTPKTTTPTLLPNSEALKVKLRDSVRYCFIDSPDEDAFVTIIDSQSNPDLGLLNKDTPVAKGLLGAAIGQEREVALPMGKSKIRVLDILKPRPRYS